MDKSGAQTVTRGEIKVGAQTATTAIVSVDTQFGAAKFTDMFALVRNGDEWKIVNVVADETVLSENGGVDPAKLNALIFDQFQSGYYVTGEKVGQAWSAGKPLIQKK